MSFAISSSINAAALSARRAASGSDNVRARAFVRAQPKKSVKAFSICADDAFAARVRAAMAAVGGPPPTPKAEIPQMKKAGAPVPPPPAPKAAAPAPPPPAPKAAAPANDFSWDPAPRGAPAAPAAPAARRQAVDLENIDPDFAPKATTNSGYSAPAPAAPTHRTAPTSNVVSFGARKQAVDLDNIDPDFAPKRQTVGAGAAPAAATYGSSSASSYGSSYGGGSKPTKVERRGGVTYDPDQFDAENTVRFGRR